jgi:putative hemolysin
VTVLLEYAPWLATMAVLVAASAFFSGSEAAFFYLSEAQRRRLGGGNLAQRSAARLLDDPDRLLGAVLFWNLTVNVAYFAISSIVSLSLDRAGRHAEAGAVALGSLLGLIVLSEMLPKNLAVLRPDRVAVLVGVPLAALVRLVDPVLPALRAVNLLSRRLLWPRFEPEPYLHVRDLERAVELSTADAALVEQEQSVLQRIVQLSEIRVDELMRPRRQFRAFRPPVHLADLGGRMTPSGYLLVTEADDDEVCMAVALGSLTEVPNENLEGLAQPVAFVPWCAPVARALDAMQRRRNPVAAVVNEYGETIGVVTFDDILETVFGRAPSRSLRLLKRAPIRQTAPGVWQVTGMTSLWRLSRHFGVRRPPSRSVTVAGVIQENLERFPSAGDECLWGPFRMKIVEASERGQLLVELTLVEPPEDPS